VERCQGSGCTTFAQIASVTTTSYSDAGLTASTSYRYRVRATDAAGNLSGYSSTATATTPALPDTMPPSVPTGLQASSVTASSVTISWTPATDNVGVTGYRVFRDGIEIASGSQVSYADSGLVASTTYSYTVAAFDAAGNVSAPSAPLAVTTLAAPSSLVAAYDFGEGSGTTTADASPSGITATLQGATWTTGHSGNALSFNGSSNYADLGNPAALRLTGSMTVSAWVLETGNVGDDGQIIAKSNGTTGWQLKSTPDTGARTFGVAVNAAVQRYSRTVRALNTWYHVAGVYNASTRTLDIYVNGVLDNGTLVGTVPTSQKDAAVNVNIGRRTGGFYIKGKVDDVRVYNRALSPAEIQADMNSAL